MTHFQPSYLQVIPNPVHRLEMNIKCVNGEVFKLLAHLEMKVRLYVNSFVC